MVKHNANKSAVPSSIPLRYHIMAYYNIVNPLSHYNVIICYYVVHKGIEPGTALLLALCLTTKPLRRHNGLVVKHNANIKYLFKV